MLRSPFLIVCSFGAAWLVAITCLPTTASSPLPKPSSTHSLQVTGTDTVCASCAVMVDDAKEKQHAACPGASMTECDVQAFKIIMISELLANCTSALVEATNADATCFMCEECVLKMDKSQVQDVMDTEVDILCSSMTGYSCSTSLVNGKRVSLEHSGEEGQSMSTNEVHALNNKRCQ